MELVNQKAETYSKEYTSPLDDVLLDNEIPRTGKVNTTWNIVENLDIETIKSSVFS